jgi:Ca2+-binding RTX toxin-like protein
VTDANATVNTGGKAYAEAAGMAYDAMAFAGTDSDVLVGGEGDDTLYGDTFNLAYTEVERAGSGNGASSTKVNAPYSGDVLIGDGQGMHEGSSLQDKIEGTASAEVFHKYLDQKSDADLGAYFKEHESTTDGNDKIFAGNGDDILAGMGGNDYLDGGAGADKLYGGSGNDLLKYDENDLVINGGAGIDFLLGSDAPNASLAGDKTVSNVEFALNGEGVTGLTSIKDIIARGITIADDNKSVTLGEDWTFDAESNTFSNGSLTLTYNSETVIHDTESEEAIKFIINNIG